MPATEWRPIEWDTVALQRAIQQSAIETLGSGRPMASNEKRVPRSGGMSAKIGKTYTADETDNDTVVLESRKFNGLGFFDEDDLSDIETTLDAIAVKQKDWATTYAVKFDNSCIGVTAAKSSTDADERPFTSVYKAVRTNGTADTPESGYSADANYINWNGAASAAYDKLSEALRVVEVGAYFNEPDALIIADPAFRAVLRGVKDNNGTPVFVQGQGGDSGQPDSLFGIEIVWSRGARTANKASDKPEGNPLLVFCGDRNQLLRGDRLNPEFRYAPSEVHGTTDEAAIKFRARKAFAVGHVNAFAVLEKTA
ncbi:phage major capsid protein [Streptomyces sp. ISL-10]|uniref:phage major capsid protein n=1 Tax=Streptomyces sp. ISL-10 TaxID=2819172 RepID=UPI001BE7FD72|nr:phage major capsid protein [Streptomyces sp. ISL-10]MBT2365240.1 phage major capsid protein [Streptomyces sp. ISL-10]